MQSGEIKKTIGKIRQRSGLANGNLRHQHRDTRKATSGFTVLEQKQVSTQLTVPY